jgi:hypothetical protein
MRIIVLDDGETYTGAEGCLCLDIKSVSPFVSEIPDELVKQASRRAKLHHDVTGFRMEDENSQPYECTVIARF